MMQTQATAAGVSLRSLFPQDNANNVPDVVVTDITSDSRKAKQGGLFLACEGGSQHGLEFVDQALAANIAAVAWEPTDQQPAPDLPADVVGFEVPGLGACVGEIADRFFGQPSSQLTVTGVTGTNGKTTVARLASAALSQIDGDSGYMGTMGYGLGDSLEPSSLTTPGCIVVHRRIRELADAGACSVVMEVSSHGLDQGRIDGVRISIAVLTNLSRDHLDYHGSLDAYGEAKGRLFVRPEVETAVVNVGDNFGAALVGRQLVAQRIIRVAVSDTSTEPAKVDLLAELLDADESGLKIRFSGEFGTCEFGSPMWGRFNVENLALAAGVVIAHGFSLQQAAGALSQLKSPEGRMQVLPGNGQQCSVVVDFAHTPAALEQALRALHDHCEGDVWCVFGCGGNRDQGKRAAMGAAAEANADHVVVTDDNPRYEDSAEIIRDILAGVSSAASIEVIADRAAAIRAAVERAAPGDAVLVAGKGSEEYQLISDQRIAFSDVDVVRKVLGGSN